MKRLWLRSWRNKRGQFHIEVRDPRGELLVTEVYQGKDHTLHIILEKK